MKKLVIVVAMAVAVVAYKDRRNSALEDFPPYPETRYGLPFHEQHQSFRESPFRPQQYQSYRRRPYRQDLSSFPEQLSLRDQSLLRDYSSAKGQHFHADETMPRDSLKFRGQSFVSDETYRDRVRFKNDQILEDQSQNDQYYRQPAFRDDFRFADLYDKPINSYREQQPEKFAEDYLKHGNHGLGYIPVPPISPYENVLPLSDVTSTTTTPSMDPATTHQPWQQSTVSNVASAIAQVHTSATSEPKVASPKASHTATMPTVKSDTLAEATTTTFSPLITTKATILVTTNQSSNVVDPHSALTTEASFPVMATESPILSFGRQTLPPIEFQSTKFTTPSSYYFPSSLKNKLQQSLLSYLLSQQAKSPIKLNEQTSLSNYVSPDVLTNSLDNKLPTSMLNYVLPEESKATLKGNLQSSLLSYLLQQESNRGLSFQQSSPSSDPLNFVSLASLAEKPKITLPTVPIATLSAVSRPLQSYNYVPITVPRTSNLLGQGSSVSSILPLGTSLPSLSSSIGDSQATGVFNSLPGGISGGISTGIPANIATTVPAGLPSLNFAQNFQHIDQTRQFEPARSNPFSPGLQLQLGGFGGIDYTLRSPNPAPRPFELGIAKVGLSLPELPRQQLSTLSKIQLGPHFL